MLPYVLCFPPASSAVLTGRTAAGARLARGGLLRLGLGSADIGASDVAGTVLTSFSIVSFVPVFFPAVDQAFGVSHRPPRRRSPRHRGRHCEPFGPSTDRPNVQAHIAGQVFHTAEFQWATVAPRCVTGNWDAVRCGVKRFYGVPMIWVAHRNGGNPGSNLGIIVRGCFVFWHGTGSASLACIHIAANSDPWTPANDHGNPRLD